MPLWCIFIYTHMDNYNIENNNEQHECCMHGPGPDLHCSCVTTGNCSGADYKMFEWDYKCPTCTFHPDPFKRLQCFIRALATKGLASEKKIEEIEKILNGDDNVEGLIDKVESMLTDATIIDDHLDDDSANPVQNNVIKEAIDELRASLRQKQDTLTSGINIKTINGYPILGSGDISVGGETTWDSVTNKPTFATVATTGSYADLVGKPNLAAVAFSGSYNDLLNKPAPGLDIVVDAQLSNTSENPVQNKVVAEEISSLSGACNNLQMNKQQKLTSDTVLGTINGQSLTYGGSVSIATGGGADVKTLRTDDEYSVSLSGTGTVGFSGENGIVTSGAGAALKVGLTQQFRNTVSNKQDKLTSSSILGTINGETLRYGDSITIPGGGGDGVTALRQLSDVNTTGIANGKILRYNSTTQKWTVGDDNAGVTSVKVGDTTYTPNGSGLINIPALASTVALSTSATSSDNVVDLVLRQNDEIVNTVKVQGTQGITSNRTGGGADVLVLGTNLKTVGGQSLVNTTTPVTDIPIPTVNNSTITFAVDDGNNRSLGGTITLNQGTAQTIYLPAGSGEGDGPQYIENPYTLPMASNGVLGGIMTGYTPPANTLNIPLKVNASGAGYVTQTTTNTITQNSILPITSGGLYNLNQTVVGHTSAIEALDDLLYTTGSSETLPTYTTVSDFEYHQEVHNLGDFIELTGDGVEGVYQVIWKNASDHNQGKTLEYVSPVRRLKFDVIDRQITALGNSTAALLQAIDGLVDSVIVSTSNGVRAIRYTTYGGSDPTAVIPIDSTPSPSSTNLITSGAVYALQQTVVNNGFTLIATGQKLEESYTNLYKGTYPEYASISDFEYHQEVHSLGETIRITSGQDQGVYEVVWVDLADHNQGKTLSPKKRLKADVNRDDIDTIYGLLAGELDQIDECVTSVDVNTVGGAKKLQYTTSGGLTAQDIIGIDSAITQNSQNLITSGALYSLNQSAINSASAITALQNQQEDYYTNLYRGTYPEYATIADFEYHQEIHSLGDPIRITSGQDQGVYEVVWKDDSDHDQGKTLSPKLKLKADANSDRIDDAFGSIASVLDIADAKVDSVQRETSGNSDKLTYTVGVTDHDIVSIDSTPTSSSSNLITSGGVYSATSALRSIDSTPTNGSSNLVSSGGVYSAINNAVGNANVDFDYGTGKKRGTDLTEVINTVNYSGTCSSQIMDSDSHTKILNAQIDVVYFNAKNESGSFSRQTARLQVNITYSNGTYDIGDVATKFATLGDFTLYGRPYLEVTQNSSDQTKADVNMYFCLTSAKLQIHSLTIELHNDNGQLPYFVQTRNDIDHNYTYSNNKKVVYFDTWDNVIVIFIHGKWYKLADADPFPLRPMSGS